MPGNRELNNQLSDLLMQFLERIMSQVTGVKTTDVPKYNLLLRAAMYEVRNHDSLFLHSVLQLLYQVMSTYLSLVVKMGFCGKEVLVL
jgi:hypothetical protein